MNKGRTAIEILVVITIAVVTTAVGLYSFPNFTQRVMVERAVRELAIKIRTAQQRTLAPKQVRKADGTLAVPRGFGIYLDRSLAANTSYIFFADVDGNNFFNTAGGDVVIETINLPQGVIVSELKLSSGALINAVNIVYTVPFSQTKIYDAGGAPITGDMLQVKLSRGADIVRYLTARTTGLVTLGASGQQITQEAPPPPTGGNTCAGSEISNVANEHWAYNNIIGWIDFCLSGNVRVTASNVTGYATSTGFLSSVSAPETQPAANVPLGTPLFPGPYGGASSFDSFGALKLDCNSQPQPDCTTSWGVKNNGSGVLSGWAWLGGPVGFSAEPGSYGWVSFNCSNRNSCSFVPYQVTIDPATGDFHGFAWNDIIGWISFNCADTPDNCATSNYKLNTIWRPGGLDPFVNLKANASDGLTIPYGSSAVFTWNSQNTGGCTTTNSQSSNPCWCSGVCPTGTSSQNSIGTKCSNLQETTTFTINCTGTSDFVTVNVLPQPSVNIKADGLEGGPPSNARNDPIVISLNTSATLTWLSSTGTVSCLASGNWSGSKAINNNTVGQPAGPQAIATTTTYYLDCANVVGSTIRDWVKVRWQ